MSLRLLAATLFGALMVGGVATSAIAAPIDCSSTTFCSFSLDNFIGSGTAPAGPYGTITLTQNGANIDVTVTAVSNAYFARTGAGEAFLWDFKHDPSLTGKIVLTGTSVGKFTFDSNAGHQDGSGSWDYGMICSACGSGGSPPNLGELMFTIVTYNLADFVKNNKGNNFAVDMCLGYIAGTGCSVTGDVLAAFIPPPTRAPEPMTLSILGAGLVGAAAFRRRKAKA